MEKDDQIDKRHLWLWFTRFETGELDGFKVSEAEEIQNGRIKKDTGEDVFVEGVFLSSVPKCEKQQSKLKGDPPQSLGLRHVEGKLRCLI